MEIGIAFSNAFAFVLLVTAAGLAPGPTTLLLLVSGLQVGVSRSLPLVMASGLALSLIFIGSAYALDASGLTEAAAPYLRGFAAAYLCFLAWRIIASPLDPALLGRRTMSARDLLLVTMINPKAWMMAISIQVGFLPAGPSAVQILAAMAAFVALTLPCFAAWSVFGSQLRRLIRTPAAARGLSVVMGAAILLSVAMTFLPPTR